jgi:DNA replication protein DnaC
VVSVQVGQCRCGAEVRRDFSDHPGGWLRERLEAMPFVCDACATAADEREREEESLREQAVAARRHSARRTASGIPATLLDLDWDDLDQPGREAILAAARRWSSGELAGLALTGPVGVGKTRIAAVAANEMLVRRPLRWTSAPLLFARLGDGFGSTNREHALDVLVGGHALVLDDIDKVRPTAYAAEQVFAAVDNRVTEGIPLLVTTNLGAAALAAKFPEPFGEAIASRLVGYGEGYRLTGPDRRTAPAPSTVTELAAHAQARARSHSPRVSEESR